MEKLGTAPRRLAARALLAPFVALFAVGPGASCTATSQPERADAPDRKEQEGDEPPRTEPPPRRSEPPPPPPQLDASAPLAPASRSEDDAGVDRRPSAACDPPATLCDGFEAYETGSQPTNAWRASTRKGTLAVDETKAYRGSKSLHLVVEPNGRNHAAFLTLSGAPIFPAQGNALFGRMMLWQSDAPPFVHHNHVIASGSLPGSRKAHFAYGAMYIFMANYLVTESDFTPPVVDCGQDSKRRPPLKRWTCIEWQFDGVTNQMRHWIDGTPTADLAAPGPTAKCSAGLEAPGGLWQAPVFSSLKIGLQQYHSASVPVEAWIDEVAVGPDRIGCPPR